MSLREPKAFLFDLGGVVIGIEGNRAPEYWAKVANVDPARLLSDFVKDEHYNRHERGELACADFFDHMQQQLDISISDAQMLAGWNAIFVGAIPGIEVQLHRARQLGSACAFSNTNPSHVDFFTPRHGDLLDLFDQIYLSSTIGMRKPESEAFRHVADEMGYKTEDILFFDDSLENVEGAIAVGMQAVHVRSIEDVVITLDKFDR